MTPVISIIIPVYNGERFLAETIRSAANQTFRDLEILIINDGSTDKTLELAQGSGDDRVKVFSFPHAGLSTSRNQGIRLAQGEYLAFLDADDLWSADKLEAQLLELRDHPNAAVAYSWVDLIDSEGRYLRPFMRPFHKGNVYEKLLFDDFIIGGSNVLIRRRALKKTGFFDEALGAAEDHDVWIRLAKDFEFVLVPKVQLFYRQSDGAMSSDLLKQMEGNLKVIDKAFSVAPRSLQRYKSKAISIRYLCVADSLSDGTRASFDRKKSLACVGEALRSWPLSIFTVKFHWILFKHVARCLVPGTRTPRLINKVRSFFMNFLTRGKNYERR